VGIGAYYYVLSVQLCVRWKY